MKLQIYKSRYLLTVILLTILLIDNAQLIYSRIAIFNPTSLIITAVGMISSLLIMVIFKFTKYKLLVVAMALINLSIVNILVQYQSFEIVPMSIIVSRIIRASLVIVLPIIAFRYIKKNYNQSLTYDQVSN